MVSFEALNLTCLVSLQQLDASCRKSIDISKNRGETDQQAETLVMNVK